MAHIGEHARRRELRAAVPRTQQQAHASLAMGDFPAGFILIINGCNWRRSDERQRICEFVSDPRTGTNRGRRELLVVGRAASQHER
jgi:hypothetical protein